MKQNIAVIYVEKKEQLKINFVDQTVKNSK